MVLSGENSMPSDHNIFFKMAAHHMAIMNENLCTIAYVRKNFNFFSRGRDRALALQFDQNHGCFTHRCKEISFS